MWDSRFAYFFDWFIFKNQLSLCFLWLYRFDFSRLLTLTTLMQCIGISEELDSLPNLISHNNLSSSTVRCRARHGLPQSNYVFSIGVYCVQDGVKKMHVQSTIFNKIMSNNFIHEVSMWNYFFSIGGACVRPLLHVQDLFVILFF